MMKGIGLVALAQKIDALKSLKRDYVVPTEQLTMVAQAAQANEPARVALEVPDPQHGVVSYPLQDRAHGQLAQRLKIDSRYYERLRAEAPELLAVNVNHWLQATPEKRMVRMLGGEARAFLSNRYNRIENEEVAEVALPILLAIPDVEVVSCEVTERRMYIQATTPRVRGEVKKGDVVQAGVCITNSEVGEGAVSVAALYWRLWCSNGAVSVDKFRAFHVGRQVEDTSELWADDTRRADDRAVLLKVRDMVAAAVDATRFGEQVAKMQALAGAELQATSAQRAVEVLSKKIGATEGEQASILTALIKGGDLSAWGLVNAVTFQAHGAKSYDRAVEFEAAGGALIDMPAEEWRRVLAPAN